MAAQAHAEGPEPRLNAELAPSRGAGQCAFAGQARLDPAMRRQFGNLALHLNFLRYRHTVSSTAVRLKVEIIEEMTKDDFSNRINAHDEAEPWKASSSEITHLKKIRNVGSVPVHIQDAWATTRDGQRKDATRRSAHDFMIHQRLKETGNFEIKPRSSLTLSVFSIKDEGYLELQIPCTMKFA